MKRKVVMLLAILGVLGLTGCEVSTSNSVTYNVLNETIKVSFKNYDGMKFSVSNDGSGFKVTDSNGKSLIDGTFTDESTYVYYYNLVKDNELVYESSIKDDSYTFYEFDGQAGAEHNCLIDLDNSDVYVIIGSISDKSVVDDCVSRLSFKGEN